MKQTVERILEGQFDCDKKELNISVPKIEAALCPDGTIEGSFTVEGPKGANIKGTVYCDDIRITFDNDTFLGEVSEIKYSFSSRGLIPGDVCQGDICIVSNQGEHYIPYVFTINRQDIDSSLGGIKSLFHFANLARTNWEEAVKLFYSDDFESLLVGNDRQYRKAYLGFSRYYGNERNLDSFLVEISKKNEIEYIIDNNNLTIRNPEHLREERIQITRNGWGYTSLNVSTDSEAIILNKLELNDSDFLGNFINYYFRINAEALHSGNNYATITFYNDSFSVSANIVINVATYSREEVSAHVRYEQLNHELITFYEAFRNRKITLENWVHETGRIVTLMQEADENSIVPKLFKTLLLITEERFNEAEWLLSKISMEMEEQGSVSPVARAFYLYLSALNNREESYIDDVTLKVTEIFDNNPSEWRIAWMILYLSEEFAISPSKRWLFIAEQIEKNCTSPVFYLEAVNMLLVNPGLLIRLGEYELKVLRYASDNELMNPELTAQFIYLAANLRSFNETAYVILKKAYDREPTSEIVETIVKLLIKGDRKGPEFADWYLKAINAELRITKLFEYYFESIDINEDIDIPQMVYLYFSYQTNLDYVRSAYLYSRVIAKREEMPEVYASYSDRIREFAIDEIKKEHINSDLVSIYKFILTTMPGLEDIAEALSRIIFMHKIEIKDPAIQKVIVYQNRENYETSYAVNNGVVYVPLYNRDFTLLFEDSFTNRYMKTVEYDLQKLMVPGKIATMILPYVKNNTEFDIYSCECSSAMVTIDAANISKYQTIMDAPFVDPAYKREISEKLMQYYFDNDMVRELDELLGEASPQGLTQKERASNITFMLNRGMFDMALEWIISFGTEGVDIKTIVKLCSKLIARGEFVKDATLLKLSADAFLKGKFDENILKYLAMHYEGMTKNMRKVFKACEDYMIDSGKISERIILQTLYTGYFVPEKAVVYKRYVQYGADEDVQKAFIMQNCFDYFVEDQVTDFFVFDELEKMYVRNVPLLDVCKLAYLKYYADIKDNQNELSRKMINEFMDEMVKADLYLNIFAKYIDKIGHKVNKFSDKTIIEYKTDAGKTVWIHYIIENDSGTSSEYITEEMKAMVGGIYSKPFTLFYGETLLYYITESNGGEELLTESGSIQKSDISNGITNSRFNIINDLVVSESLRDYEAVNDIIYEIKERDYVISRMFSLR